MTDWPKLTPDQTSALQSLCHLVLVRGIELGLEAAGKVAAEKVEKRIGVPCPDGVEGCLAFHFKREYHDKSAFVITHEIRALNPETIAQAGLTKPTQSDLPPSSSDILAREAVLDQLTREAQADNMGYDND